MERNNFMKEPATSGEMQDRLRVWEAQARRAVALYSARPVPKKADIIRERDMVYWLPEACKTLRVINDRVPSQIAAAMRKDQSKISRFEGHALKQFPRDLGEMLEAYAEELDVPILVIWQTAIMLWQCDIAKRIAPEDVQKIVEDVVRQSRQRPGSKRAAASGPPR